MEGIRNVEEIYHFKSVSISEIDLFFKEPLNKRAPNFEFPTFQIYSKLSTIATTHSNGSMVTTELITRGNGGGKYKTELKRKEKAQDNVTNNTSQCIICNVVLGQVMLSWVR